MASYPWKDVLITGASSGIGKALAEALAAPGVSLHLSGRDAGRLAETVASCRSRGATVREAVLDVTDADGMAAWVRGAGTLDLVVANAGISGGTGTAQEPVDQARRIFAVNVTGVLNTALPAIEMMAAQPPGAEGRRGHVAVVASIAAFLAAPGAPAYCASKSAVQRWAEALDVTERRRGIRVSAICPGYVRSPMTARNPFPMPLLMEPDVAAGRILAGLVAGKSRVVFPRRLYWAARLFGALPAGLRNRALMRVPGKPTMT